MRAPTVIDLNDMPSELRAARRHLFVCSLLAIKDRASELGFTSDHKEDTCRRWYKIDGTDYDIEPPPASLLPELIRELHTWMNPNPVRRGMASALRSWSDHLGGHGPSWRFGWFSFKVGEHVIKSQGYLRVRSNGEDIILQIAAFPSTDQSSFAHRYSADSR